MKESFIAVSVVAQTETDKAFCGRDITFCVGSDEEHVITEAWIPKSVILEDSLDTIEEATRGETVEIYVTAWWLRQVI